MATIATAAKADKVLGWWEFFRGKMMIERATDEADTAGLRGREEPVSFVSSLNYCIVGVARAVRFSKSLF